MRVFVLFLLSLSACPGGGLTSESLGKNRLNRGIASLSGFVRHASVPVTGATVSMGDSTDITRADGGFSLIDLPSGAQTLRISASGFSELSFDVDVVLGSNDVGELQLRLAAGCACADDELCTEGVCVAQPYDCAASGCPMKSYCDNAQNKCVAGCLSNDHCPAGRVCDTKKNDCVCGELTHNCFGVCASNDAVATCGQACSPCIAPANATATCNGEACDFSCNAGFQRCNANACCPIMENIKTVTSTGYNMNCLTTQSNEVYCWGNNDSGSVGDGTSLTLRAAPVRLDALFASQLALGFRFTCALGLGGGVQCWGRGSTGQLGNNAALSTLTPVDVFELTSGATQISAGSDHACAVLADGRLKCWGGNNHGELGNGAAGTYLVKPSLACTNTTSCTPHFSNVAQVSAGLSITCAVKDDGTLYCWGLNSYGRLGMGGSEVMRTIPQHVSSLSDVSRVAVGDGHVCALTSGGALYCWGSNNVGQLGDGTKTQRSFPVLVIAQGVSDFAVGSSHTCAVISGDVKCWGGNDRSQVGDGSIDDRTSPTSVVGLTAAATGVSAGDEHSCALLASGRLQCWGANADGQLGNTQTTSSPTPVYVVQDF